MTRGHNSIIPVPANRLRWFFSQTYPYDVAIAFFAASGGAASAVRAFAATKSGWFVGGLWVGAVAGVFIATVLRIIAQVKNSSAAESTHELEGCLHVLYGILVADMKPRPRVRLTIYVPVDDGRSMQQIVGYVSGKRIRGQVGRKFPIQCGIIGRAYLERTMQIAMRANFEEEEFVQELMREWHFTEDDARNVNSYTKAWLAVPIFLQENQEVVHGVVFADANKAEFFDERAQRLILAACSGIATYLSRRYS